MTSSSTASTVAPDAGAHSDPASQPGFVPVQTRSERPRSFDPADFGMPTGREVNWKHTPLDRLATVLSDEASELGAHNAIDYELAQLDAFLVESTGHDAAVRGEFFVPEDRVAALAWKHCANALHIRIPAEHEATDPLRIDLRGRGGHAQAHIIIEAMPHAKATVLLYHSGSAHYAQNVEIIVRDGAQLTVISVQRWDAEAIHLAAHQARVDRDARLRHIVASLGGGVVRVNPTVQLSGRGAEAELFGLSYADSGQHLESQVYLHHEGPHTRGDVLYKGVLQGERARSVWIGDVLIGRDAVGTDSYEANRNLVLTEGARADSIPNLEIETGDIRGAGHASATGRFDDEQLFYLQSRGISEAEARRLVVMGFLGEIVQQIGIPSLQEELIEAIDKEIVEGAA